MAIESGIAAVLSALTNGLREGLDRRSKKRLEERAANLEERKMSLMEKELAIKEAGGGEDSLKTLLGMSLISSRNTEAEMRKLNLERGFQSDLADLYKNKTDLSKDIYLAESSLSAIKDKESDRYKAAKSRIDQLKSNLDSLNVMENRTKSYLDAIQGRRGMSTKTESGISEKEVQIINQIHSFQDEASLVDYYRKIAPTLSASAKDKLKSETQLMIRNFRTTAVEQPAATPTEQEHVGPQQPGIPFGGQFEALGKGLKSLITPSRGQ